MAQSSERFLYSGIRVRDLAASLRCYRALGFRVRSRGTMLHGGKWVHLVHPSSRHRLELNFYPRGNRFHEPWRGGVEFDHFGFYLKNVDAWYRRMLRAGARPGADFVEGKIRIVYVVDPNGVWLEGFGPATPPRRPRRRA